MMACALCLCLVYSRNLYLASLARSSLAEAPNLPCPISKGRLYLWAFFLTRSSSSFESERIPWLKCATIKSISDILAKISSRTAESTPPETARIYLPLGILTSISYNLISMKKLYFIRHGESVSNVERWHAGRIDTPLTERGRQQAREAGKKAKAQKLHFDLIVSSPLSRALETARIIAKEIGYPEKQ